MTHSLSVTAADSPPEMYRRATLAIVVSRISMKVGMRTATAISHGPKRWTGLAVWGSAVMAASSPARSGGVLREQKTVHLRLAFDVRSVMVRAILGGGMISLHHHRLRQFHRRLQHL